LEGTKLLKRVIIAIAARDAHGRRGYIEPNSVPPLAAGDNSSAATSDKWIPNNVPNFGIMANVGLDGVERFFGPISVKHIKAGGLASRNHFSEWFHCIRVFRDFVGREMAFNEGLEFRGRCFTGKECIAVVCSEMREDIRLCVGFCHRF
jgi:hypothetical protein